MRVPRLMFAGGVLFILVGLFAAPVIALALDEDELPPDGTLSTSMNTGGSQGFKVDGVWGDVDPSGKETAPITGSVSQKRGREWQMRIFNNSESKYRVTVEVIQFTDRGKRLRGTTYSYTLNGGENRTRDIKALPQTSQCSLKLKSWKNLSPPREPEVQ